MDDEITEVNIKCVSEKTRDAIGCGIYFDSAQSSTNEIDIQDVFDSLEECFWELLFEFERLAQDAFDNGEISGTDQNELFKVFGHFRFISTVGDEEINLDLGIDPDEFMYSMLVDYLEINGDQSSSEQ